jgi:hypothetical protein
LVFSYQAASVLKTADMFKNDQKIDMFIRYVDCINIRPHSRSVLKLVLASNANTTMAIAIKQETTSVLPALASNQLQIHHNPFSLHNMDWGFSVGDCPRRYVAGFCFSAFRCTIHPRRDCAANSRFGGNLNTAPFLVLPSLRKFH